MVGHEVDVGESRLGRNMRHRVQGVLRAYICYMYIYRFFEYRFQGRKKKNKSQESQSAPRKSEGSMN